MKWMHEFLGKFIFRSPRAYSWGPKSLLLSSPDGKDAFPSVHILNMSNCRKLDFSVREDRLKEEKIFILIANVYEPGASAPQVLELGKFETRAEAAGALLQLKSKLYSPGVSILKGLFFVLAFFFLLGIFIDSGKSWLFSKAPAPQVSAAPSMPQYSPRSLPAPRPQVQAPIREQAPEVAPPLEFKEGSALNDALKQGLSK